MRRPGQAGKWPSCGDDLFRSGVLLAGQRAGLTAPGVAQRCRPVQASSHFAGRHLPNQARDYVGSVSIKRDRVAFPSTWSSPMAATETIRHSPTEWPSAGCRAWWASIGTPGCAAERRSRGSPPLPPKSKLGRPRTSPHPVQVAPVQRANALLAAEAEAVWQTIIWRRGNDGPFAQRFLALGCTGR